MDSAFSTIRLRVGALVCCQQKVVLIRRRSSTGAAYTVPGGNVHQRENLEDALSREIHEELGLTPDDWTEVPKLLFIQDQMVSRPGITPAPRKLHFIFRINLRFQAKNKVREHEIDELGVGDIVWVDPLSPPEHIYPNLGNFLSSIIGTDDLSYPVLLPSMTDANYIWRP